MHINGIPWYRIKTLFNNALSVGCFWGNGVVALQDNQKVLYDHTKKIITFPSAFSLYRGSGKARGSISVDLSEATRSNDACNLYIKADGTIYGTTWSGNNAQDNNDQLLGYIYRRNVFIEGVPESMISVEDDNTALVCYCFGDSITAGVGSNKPYHVYFHEQISNSHFYNWAIGSTGFLVETSDNVCVGNGVEGAGSWRRESGNNTVLKVMQSIENDMPNIIIAAGTNDYGSSKPINDFRTSVQSVLDYALTKTNNILVITPIKRQGWKTSTNSQGLHLSDYSNVLKEECETRGIVCANGLDVSFEPSNTISKAAFIPDGLHPNVAGHARMARVFWNKCLEAFGK